MEESQPELPIEDKKTLAEIVEYLPVGTIFEETDPDGRKHRWLKVFNGRVILDNGWMETPVSYHEAFEDGYEIEVLFAPIEMKNPFKPLYIFDDETMPEHNEKVAFQAWQDGHDVGWTDAFDNTKTPNPHGRTHV